MPLLLAGCGVLKIAPNQVAQDAQTIVAGVTPVVNGLGNAVPGGAAVQLGSSLGTATAEARLLIARGTPSLIDEQEFLDSATGLMRRLGSVPNLPPAAQTVVDAANALLATIADAVSEPVQVRPKMSPEQARAILAGTPPAPAPTPAAPASAAVPPVSAPPISALPAAAPSAAAPAPVLRPGVRFHLSADVVDGRLRYQFFDRGQILESGTADDVRALGARFEAFQKARLAQSP